MMLTVTQQRVLLALKGRKLTLSEIYQVAGMSPNTVQRAVEELKSMGLVKEDRENTFPRRRYFTLSEKGVKVVELLEKMGEVLEQ